MDIVGISLVSWNSSITEVITVILVSLFSGLSIYSYFKNRNKKYPPGPVGIPILGYLPFLGAEPHKTFMKLRGKYGGIIGLYLGRKYTIVLNDWPAVKEVLCHSNALNRSPDTHNNIPSSLGFASANGKKWLEQRRFSIAASRDLGIGREPWETIILEEVQCFVRELHQYNGKPIDISHHLCYSLTSNILSFLIGRRYRKKEESKLAKDFIYYFNECTGPTNVTFIFPWIRKYLEMFKIAGYDKAATINSSFFRFLKDEISQHKTSPEFKDSNDFISIYLKKLSESTTSGETRQFFSESMLEGNVSLLFLVASNTISSILGWIFAFMAAYPDVQQKVYNELMDVLGKDGVARYEERHKIPYTFAVLMESQRIASIVTITTARCASNDISVRGYTIPKGAEIVANFWALHNDPEYWDEPEKFKPDRFLKDEGRVLITSPQSYVAFSIGRRNCPGETFGWMEVLFYFSDVIKRFEIGTANGQKPKFCRTTGLVQHLKPQLLSFKIREQQ